MAVPLTQVVVSEFRDGGCGNVPKLYTQTRDFRFYDRPGRLVHRKVLLGPKGYTLLASASTGHVTRFVEHDRLSLTLPVMGLLNVRADGRSLVTSPGGGCAVGPSERQSDHYPHPETGWFESHTIISPPKNAGLPCAGNLLHRPQLGGVTKFRHVIEFVMRLCSGERPPTRHGCAHIEALIEDLFLESLDRMAGRRSLKPEVRWHECVVRSAKAYMDAYSNEPLSTPDIADAIGVGTRTLQFAFQTRHGITPKQWLADARLDAMRSRLIRPEPDTTVTSAAMDSGIFHVGRCTAAYRKRFGESPARTLRRVRSRSGRK